MAASQDAAAGAAGGLLLAARNLARVLDVPAEQAHVYVENGDKVSVRRLEHALQGMPGTERCPGDSAATAASATAPSALPAELRSRMRGLCTLKTSYSGDFGSRDEQRRRAASVQAIKSIVRQEYQGQLDQWQEGAGRRDLDALADACRFLRSAGAKRVATTYGKMCKERSDIAAATAAAKASPNPHPRRRNARNNSTAVPLGSIYREPDFEALQAREESKIAALEVARVHEGELRSGAAAGEDMGQPLFSSHNTGSSLGVTKGCFAGQAHPGNTKSLSQCSWHVGVHKKGKAEQYGHRFVLPGEKAWHDCKHDAAFSLGVHCWPRGLAASQSLPQLRCQ